MDMKIKILVAGLVLFLFLFGCPLTGTTKTSDPDISTNTNCDSMDYYSKIPCYQNLALENNTVTYCDKIEGKSFVVECYWRVASKTNSLSICDKLNEYSDKSFCYQAFAQETKNSEVCEILPVGYYDYNITKAECYTGVAISSKDKSVCLKINDELRQKMCISDANRSINGDYD
jgi:hypothetical protein